MGSIPLQHPIIVNDQQVASVTLRRLTGDDMVKIGDHLKILMDQAPTAGAEGEAPRSKGVMNSEFFAAVVGFVGAITGLGENAGKLDWADLLALSGEGMNVVGG